MKKIIEEMKNQHQVLMQDCTNILKTSQSNKKFDFVEKLLDKFKNHLIIHLKLENDIFYPTLLKEMALKNLDIKNTLNFIGEMKIIENQIHLFLNKFKKNKIIEINFYKEFQQIVNIVKMRITAEEDGVYIYCDAYDWCDM